MGLGDATFPIVVAAVRVEPGVGVVHATALERGERGIALVRGLHLGPRMPFVAHGQPHVGRVSLFIHGLKIEGQAPLGIVVGPQVRAAGHGDQLRGIALASGDVPVVAPDRAAEHRRALGRWHILHQGRVLLVLGHDLGKAFFR